MYEAQTLSKWSVRLARSRTPLFHGGDTGSNPVRTTKKAAVSIKGHDVLAPSILKSRADHSSPDRFETVGMTVVYEGTPNNRRPAVTGDDDRGDQGADPWESSNSTTTASHRSTLSGLFPVDE